METRMAEDGQQYTREEFERWYGPLRCTEKWWSAGDAVVAPQGATSGRPGTQTYCPHCCPHCGCDLLAGTQTYCPRCGCEPRCPYCGAWPDFTHRPGCPNEEPQAPPSHCTTQTQEILRLLQETLLAQENYGDRMLKMELRLKRQDDLLARLQLDVVNLQYPQCNPVPKHGVSICLGGMWQQICELPSKAFERIAAWRRLSARRS